MNVLNVDDLERQLSVIAARAVYPQIKSWILSVARNFILNIDAERAEREYVPVTKRPPKREHNTLLPRQLPDWATRDLSTERPVHAFQLFGCERRTFWKQLDTIVNWLNATVDPKDPSINRLDRLSFGDAWKQAEVWLAKISENPWLHVKDKPPVRQKAENGWFWVELITDAHFKREGQIMNNCIGGGHYYRSKCQGRARYFSLRDKHNEPHISMEVSCAVGGGCMRTAQIKGKNNQKPARQYQRYVRPFLTHMNIKLDGDSCNLD